MNLNLNPEIVVIGGGPAGLAAALAAKDGGVKAENILIIERENILGGILKQCIHSGFGVHYFGEELTGPEYAYRFIEKVKEAGIGSVCNAMVLSFDCSGPEKSVCFTSPEFGYRTIKTKAIILAMGCRERARGTLSIPGDRPAGIFTAGTAQRYVNLMGYLPGKKVVILGSGDIGLIMARRLTLEGARIVQICEIMPKISGLQRNVQQCVSDFGIPLRLSCTAVKICGKKRVEGVVVANVDEDLNPIAGSEKLIPCDTVLLSCGLVPENELSASAGLKLDERSGGLLCDDKCQTSAEGVFACGNVHKVHPLVDDVSKEAEIAGRGAAEYVLS